MTPVTGSKDCNHSVAVLCCIPYHEAMDTNQGLKPIDLHAANIKSSAERLREAERDKSDSLKMLRNKVVHARTAGVLTVAQIAQAIGRDRSAVDGIWAAHGPVRVVVDGRRAQTRVPIEYDAGTSGGDAAIADATASLAADARDYEGARRNVDAARADRDTAIVDAYESQALGPSMIAVLAGIDRNHVLRICRKAGVSPAYRTNPKNQHTAKKEEA